MRIQTDANVGIGGFIITGTAPKHVLLRAIGPSLTQSGVPDALADPVLELHGPTGFVTITNDNWRETQEAAIIATGIPPANNLESAIVATLDVGSYTAIVRGNNNATGVGLIEAYDLNPVVQTRLANISTRGFVNVDNDVMIAGLIVGPSGAQDLKVLVRALGPTLGDFGVGGFLRDPTLDLVNSSGTLIRSSNNWKDSQRTEIEASNLAPGHDEEAALIQTLPPGAYTAIVRGSGRTTGVGLVEVYNIP
jgi:hypothetical protein